MRRLLAIFVVWMGCAVAWALLGSTLMVRSGEVCSDLEQEVQGLWGPPLAQPPPFAIAREANVSAAAQQNPAQEIAPAASNIAVKLDLEHRQKGLLWFPTYGVGFDGTYRFENTDSSERQLHMNVPLATENALYDGFVVHRADGSEVDAKIDGAVATWTDSFKPGESRRYRIRYRSRGTTRWQYPLTSGTARVRDFKLTLDADFSDVDFSAGSLSPTVHRQTDDGWHGQWRFATLVASSPIGIELPRKLNPGPLAAKITFFAPVGLLFFFFVVALLAQAKQLFIHPMNYFFFGCGFFAFHLLFAYLVDHAPVAASFAVASLVSVGLVVSYARLVVGWRFAARAVTTTQLIYLVLFSFTFFFEGYTGLAITVGAILTLFAVMQLTGRARWGEAHNERREPPLASVPPLGCVAPYRCAVSPDAETSATPA
jgi:inner membrane protein involved in colicin E2 resistance